MESWKIEIVKFKDGKFAIRRTKKNLLGRKTTAQFLACGFDSWYAKDNSRFIYCTFNNLTSCEMRLQKFHLSKKDYSDLGEPVPRWTAVRHGQ